MSKRSLLAAFALNILALPLLGGLPACGSKWTIEDADNDGVSSETDCWDNPEGPTGSGLSGADIFPGADETWYDGIDQDCLGDDDFDADGDGWVPAGMSGTPTLGVDSSGELPEGDCWDDPNDQPAEMTVVPSSLRDKDGRPLAWTQPQPGQVNPAATETLYDGVDQDCAGDDDFDQDLDGFRTDSYPDAAGAFGPDCYDGTLIDETSPSGKLPEEVHPDATEIWYDGTDDNCDGNDCDQDGDGYDRDGATRYDEPLGYCATEECDDSNPEVFPDDSIPEIWYNGDDENCNGNDGDRDGDGYWVADYDARVKASGSGFDPLPIPTGDLPGDCWDDWEEGEDIPTSYTVVPSKYLDKTGAALDWAQPLASEVHPDTVETWYDGIDQDCAGDDDLDQDGDLYRTDFYPGADGLFGQDCFDASALDSATDPAVSSPKAPDQVNPGATETFYDGTDDDCDGNDCDQDGDGYCLETYDYDLRGLDDGDCVDSGSDHGVAASTIHPGATERAADSVDQDCNDRELCYDDTDNDGHVEIGSPTHTSSSIDCAASGDGLATEPADDCNDAVATIYTGATEIVNDAVDQNCDGGDSCYQDSDRDGYGSSTVIASADLDCEDAGESGRGTDCLDSGTSAAYAYPGAAELDSATSCMMDADSDGRGSTTAPGTGTAGTDCNDAVATIYTGATEVVADGIDQNCDGGDTCYTDTDGDSYGTSTTRSSTDLDCTDSGEANDSLDCLDTGTNAAYAFPGAASSDSATACMMDFDGDNRGSTTAPGTGAAGTDCNDSAATVYPGATEIVADGVDQDCSSGDTCYNDGDGDTYGTSTTRVSTDLDCTDANESTTSTDCLDSNANAFPGAAERESTTSCREDADADGYGDASPPSGVTAGSDCNDGASTINPGATETVADGVDQDCSGGDTCYRDNDSDTYGTSTTTVSADLDCTDTGESRYSTDCLDSGTNAAYAFPGAASLESSSLCMMDYDGDNYGSTTAPGTGTAGTDCNDSSSSIRPGATETVADGVDQDCSGGDTCYRDNDGDSFGTSTTTVSSDLDCSDTNESSLSTDCLDSGTNAAYAFPGAASIDSGTSCMMDYDGDNYGSTTAPGTGTAGTDCNDSSSTIRPGGTETVADGVDQDCSGGDTCYRDNDGDSFGTTTTTVSSDLDCSDTNESSLSTDCLDSGTNAAYAFPGAASSDSTTACMMDYDGDNYGSTTAPSGGTAGTDCNDSSSSIRPGATETVADGIDQNCNGGDLCYADTDNDGYGSTSTTSSVDLDCIDSGESIYSTDCATSNANAFPGAAEEESSTACMEDADADGWGDLAPPSGVTAGTDCDDANADASPGEPDDDASDELVDNDCDQYVDEDAVSFGSIVITEISKNAWTCSTGSSCRSADATWIEVLNTEAFDIELSNWVITTCSTDGFIDDTTPDWDASCDVYEVAISPEASIVVPAGEIVVLCQDASIGTMGANCDYDYGASWTGSSPETISYSNSTLYFAILNGLIDVSLLGTTIDDVGWYWKSSSDAWPNSAKKTMCALSGSSWGDPDLNDNKTSWGYAASSLWISSPANTGSPGVASTSTNCVSSL